MGCDQAVVAELEEDLREEIGRDGLDLGEVIDLCERPRTVQARELLIRHAVGGNEVVEARATPPSYSDIDICKAFRPGPPGPVGVLAMNGTALMRGANSENPSLRQLPRAPNLEPS